MKLAAMRHVVFSDALNPVETAVYRTSFPEANASIAGPAIVEFPGQSVVVPPGARASTDQFGNIHVTLAP
jgi:N-methylhydantoinase A